MKKNIGLVWGSWEPCAFSGVKSADFLRNIDELNVKEITLIPTYFLENYNDGIRYNDWDKTPNLYNQKKIIIELLKRGITLNFRPHVDPAKFSFNINNGGDTPGSLAWRGLFKNFDPMDKNLHYIDMLLSSLDVLQSAYESPEIILEQTAPIRLDIGAELMESVKCHPASWIELLQFIKKEIKQNYPILENRVILGHNFCHHFEYLKRLDNHSEYFSRIISNENVHSNSHLLFVDDMSRMNRDNLAAYIKNLDVFSISQYMPLDISENIDEVLMYHEKNFLNEILGVELAIKETELPTFLIGEFGVGILGLYAPNVWDRDEWTAASKGNLILSQTEQKNQSKTALTGMIKYLNNPESKAKSCQLWINGEPYDVLGSPITRETLRNYWNSF